MQIVFYSALGFSAFCLLVLLLLPLFLGGSREAERLLALVQSTRKDQRKMSGKERVRELLLERARKLHAGLGLTESAQLKQRMIGAGFRADSASIYFFAAQGIGALACGLLGSFVPVNTIFWSFTGLVVGFMAPDFWLTSRCRHRKERIRKSIPDAIDLLVICVDAGLGLDQALLRVGEELDVSHPEINQEFTRVNLEQRAGKPRLDAWKSLSERTKIDEFAGFVTMLTQTERFGTPIVKALVTFSEDLRLKRRQRAEEAAAKTKIKIIFPLVFFIFPCIFIVLLAPALLSIAKGLKSMNH